MNDYMNLVLCQLVDYNTNWVYQVDDIDNYALGDKVLVENPFLPNKVEKANIVAIYKGAVLNTPATNFIFNILGYQDQSKIKTIVGKLSTNISFESMDNLSGLYCK